MASGREDLCCGQSTATSVCAVRVEEPAFIGEPGPRESVWIRLGRWRCNVNPGHGGHWVDTWVDTGA